MSGKRLEELEKALGLNFEDQELLRLALVHRSFMNERSSARQSNERLEFLGDAVLSLSVADYLYRNYPDRSEGELTDLRSALVRRETLAKWAKELNLGYYLMLGKGEAQTGGRERAVILASAFEAVLGAIYVERGLAAAAAWLLRLVEPELRDILAENRHFDYKGMLQKATRQLYSQEPVYQVVGETGPAHEPLFEIEARVDGLSLGRGRGATKLIAQQAAARAAVAGLENKLPAANPADPEPAGPRLESEPASDASNQI